MVNERSFEAQSIHVEIEEATIEAFGFLERDRGFPSPSIKWDKHRISFYYELEDVARIAKIREELRQRRRHDHAFVADRHRRQARNVGLGIGQPVFRAPARKKQSPVESSTRHTVLRIDVDLFDPRQCRQRLLAARGRVHGNDAPAGDLEADFRDGFVDDGARLFGDGLILAQEYGAYRKALAQREAAFLSDRTQEVGRELDEQTAAIARLAVCRNGTAMGQAHERRDRRLHDPVARQIVEIRDQAEAAAVTVESRIV